MRFGMDYGGTNLKAGIFTESGEAVNFVEEKLIKFTEKGDLLANLLEFAKKFIGSHRMQSGGFAIKGLVDTNKGIVLDDIGAGNLLAGRDLQKIFEQELQIPFVIDNDARAYMLGEWKFGAGRDTSSMVCMTLGTGLGCSVISQNVPYYGSDVLGGLLGGHISIDRNGPQCVCGQKGCLELYCSATALNKSVKKTLPQLQVYEDSLPHFFQLVANKDEKAEDIFIKFIDDLSVGIVNIIHAFNPELVVIGGGVMSSKELILPPLIEKVHQRAWTYPRNKVQIKAAELENKAAPLGIAFHPVFDISN